ncbi:pyridoxamine 5'-phosphate oxidase family protein [Deinococcus radiophilus]|uniref:Pyridoxamine 5'-phosphate oxidase family protein n=1 Tax=Deinococcus radiophilus TaxID=32062 RepID=A0A3S0I9G8_9DEIO|nr:pyridoxamine 5'-phosphate oxidase family protein [Deinococcus radiophilus]RTR28341.1 pyridoxamine 5'-phosphate oxidase family protein [Deinococcus radiophilus]UFA51208.1 pyridoxamine 5'-phosphate oxidase family protein [Deinococcus radiophilus]
MNLSDEMVQVLRNSVLAWLATVDADGWPNVSPKEIFAPYTDPAGITAAIAIADIASPISVSNLRINPRACLSAVDIFRQVGYKVQGHVRIIAPCDAAFTEVSRGLLELTGGQYLVRHVLLLEVEQVRRIMAPSYHLFPERSEAQRVAQAMQAYGVQPVEPPTHS